MPSSIIGKPKTNLQNPDSLRPYKSLSLGIPSPIDIATRDPIPWHNVAMVEKT